MRQILLSPRTAKLLENDLEMLRGMIAEEISDLASDGTEEDDEAITVHVARLARLLELRQELVLTDVILPAVEETQEQKEARLEKEIVGQVADEMLSNITDLDDEVIEEMVEDHLAGMAPLVPMDPDDPDVLVEYLAYEAAQRRIYRLAWLELAKKLMDEFSGTEVR